MGPSKCRLEKCARVFLDQVRQAEAGDTFRIKTYMSIVVSVAKLAFAGGDLAGCHAYTVQVKALLEAASAFWLQFRKAETASDKNTNASKMRPLMIHAKMSYIKLQEAMKLFCAKCSEFQDNLPETSVNILPLVELDLVARLSSNMEASIMAECLRQTIHQTMESLETMASELTRDCKGFQIGSPEYWRDGVSHDASLDDLLQKASRTIFVENALKPKALGQELNKFLKASSCFIQTY